MNNSIILIGQISSGKTTLFNKICREYQLVISGGYQVTKYPCIKQSVYGYGFKVIDTPPIGSSSEKIRNAQGIKNALCEGPLNQIILVVKWERSDIMKNFIKKMVIYFRKYRKIITVAVTHWEFASEDLSNPNQDKLKIIQNQFSNDIKVFGIYSVIYISRNDSPESICTNIDNILQKSGSKEFVDIDIIEQFDLIEIPDQYEFELEISKGEIEQQLKQYYKYAIDLILKLDSQKENTPVILFYLMLFLKEQVEVSLVKFQGENKQIFKELERIYNDRYPEQQIIFDFKKTLMNVVDQMADQISKKFEQSPNQLFNSIKACPNCHKIWLKETNCEEELKCGDFSLKGDQLLNQIYSKRYGFKLSRNHVLEVLEYEQFYSPNLQTKAYNKLRENGKMGCGFKLIWKELPKLSDIQLYALIDPGFLELFFQEDKYILDKQIQFNKQLLQRSSKQLESMRVIKLN
ncbi:unnamed protein product [Paramecium sonneborni]|uniref:G domain-containing protein n=1 Tax=Paramecium sonneborni TaxID=65129 RepID=A0A8S1RDR2_9CILI|nr:unnamed protein product [Paramecium sonneborni]